MTTLEVKVAFNFGLLDDWRPIFKKLLTLPCEEVAAKGRLDNGMLENIPIVDRYLLNIDKKKIACKKF